MAATFVHIALIVLFGIGAIQFSICNIVEPKLMGRALHLPSAAARPGTGMHKFLVPEQRLHSCL